ncbi:MAG: ParB/RepB/Spo0J family partition protein [Nitrososphaeria archaeon]
MQKAVSSQIRYLRLSEISAPRFLLRSSLGRIDELAESIRRKGLLNPLTVRKAGSGYELVCGWRRYNALKTLGVEEALCIVHDGLDDRDAFEIALVENVQRKQLSPMEEARAFKRYVEEFGWGSVTDLANKIGKDCSYVVRRIQFLDLPEEVQKMLEEDFERRLQREIDRRKADGDGLEQVRAENFAVRQNLVNLNPVPSHDAGAGNFAPAQNSVGDYFGQTRAENCALPHNLVNLNSVPLQETGAGNCAPGHNFVAVDGVREGGLDKGASVSKPRGFLTPSHAEELLKIKDKPDAVKEIAYAVREKGLTSSETKMVVDQVYRGIDPKQALKAAEEFMSRKFDELNAKHGFIFNGLIPSRRGIAFRLAEEFVKGDFSEEEKRRIVELVNVMSLDDALWEIRKAREAARDTVSVETDLAYARKEIDVLRARVAELERLLKFKEDLVVRCPFCGKTFLVKDNVV